MINNKGKLKSQSQTLNTTIYVSKVTGSDAEVMGGDAEVTGSER